MVSTVYRHGEKRDPRPRGSIRFRLLAALLLLAAGSLVAGNRATDSLTAGENRVTIGFVGDLLLDRGVKTIGREKGIDAVFQNTPGIFTGVELVCANLEGAVAAGEKPLNKTFRFNGPPNTGEILKKHNITLVNLANNHSIDFGRDGLRQTVENLQKYGVMSYGYGKNAEAAVQPLYITRAGITMAFIGAVCFPLEGYVYLPDRFDVGRWDAVLVGRAIKEARRKADFVFVSFHWGIEFSHRPTATQMKIARFCIDQGADAVIGSHPHVLQGIEVYKGRPIFYSLGNFIFDQAYEPACRSVLAVLRVSPGGIEEILIRPVYIRDCTPELAEGEKKEAIIADLKKYSEVFGTDFLLTGEGLQVLLPAGAKRTR